MSNERFWQDQCGQLEKKLAVANKNAVRLDAKLHTLQLCSIAGWLVAAVAIIF